MTTLARAERGSLDDAADEIEIVRDALGACMLRRTRTQLQQGVERDPKAYRIRGRSGGYPELSPEWYELPIPDRDETILREIRTLTNQVRGIHRMVRELRLSKRQERLGWTADRYVHNVVSAAAALARYVLLSMLRSSRSAAYGHILGAAASAKRFALGASAHVSGGNSVGSIRKKAGKPPTWALPVPIDSIADMPAWLYERTPMPKQQRPRRGSTGASPSSSPSSPTHVK